MFKRLRISLAFATLIFSSTSCASSVKWEGDIDKHAKSYEKTFTKFRKNICVPRAESIFEKKLKSYRGQGYWIPELEGDVDVESISSLLPEMEKKLAWIRQQIKYVKKQKNLPGDSVTKETRTILKRLLELKKNELSADDTAKTRARKEALRLQKHLQTAFTKMVGKVRFLTGYQWPVDHLKNRKVHEQYRENEDKESVKIANYTFLYRKIVEDGAWDKNHTSSDIYLRTTLDTVHYELQEHDFYPTEDARYDLEFVLDRIERELKKGKDMMLERLTEWEARSAKSLAFYKSLTRPENRKEIIVAGKKTTPNRELIKKHNRATHELKDFVYKKQAEVYKFWLNQGELARAIFVIETILLNEVGAVDGEEALERIDVARVVMNRLDKPKYLTIGEKEFIYPHLKKVVSDSDLKSERWLNALFKQGEFSFTYYYMSGVKMIFCPDMARGAKKLRKQNIKIALQALKEDIKDFEATRYFSRASMIGRIHMDAIWHDYVAFPERPGLLVDGQEKLQKALTKGDYTFLYSFSAPDNQLYQVMEIDGKNYAVGEKNGVRLFYQHRNPHYFRYFSDKEPGVAKQ